MGMNLCVSGNEETLQGTWLGRLSFPCCCLMSFSLMTDTGQNNEVFNWYGLIWYDIILLRSRNKFVNSCNWFFIEITSVFASLSSNTSFQVSYFDWLHEEWGVLVAKCSSDLKLKRTTETGQFGNEMLQAVQCTWACDSSAGVKCDCGYAEAFAPCKIMSFPPASLEEMIFRALWSTNHCRMTTHKNPSGKRARVPSLQNLPHVYHRHNKCQIKKEIF